MILAFNKKGKAVAKAPYPISGFQMFTFFGTSVQHIGISAPTPLPSRDPFHHATAPLHHATTRLHIISRVFFGKS